MVSEAGMRNQERKAWVDRLFSVVHEAEVGHRYVICIGSNDDRERNMDFARMRLKQLFPSIRFLSELQTEPIAWVSPNLFSNQLAFFHSEMEEEEVQAWLKTLERESGRKPEDKARGVICLDIDLLLCDQRILKPEDWERGYVMASLTAFPSSLANK